MKISTDVFEILTDIVEILSTPADLRVQSSDLFFGAVEPQRVPRIYYGHFPCVKSCLYLSSRYSCTHPEKRRILVSQSKLLRVGGSVYS